MSELFFLVIGIAGGYLAAVLRTFWEEKQKTYAEILPQFLKVAHAGQKIDESEFNQALAKLWLYGSKKVAVKMDKAHGIIIKPERGNIAKAFQEAIIEMRNDIQIWHKLPSSVFRWKRLEPEDVKHLYTQIGGKKTE